MKLYDFLEMWRGNWPHTSEAEDVLLRAARLAGIGEEVAEDYESLAWHMAAYAVRDAIELVDEHARGQYRGWGLTQAEAVLCEGDDDAARELRLILGGDPLWAEEICRSIGADLAQRGNVVSDGLLREEGVYTYMRDAILVLGVEEAWHAVYDAACAYEAEAEA